MLNPTRLRRLEDVIAQQRAEIERLQAQVETLTQQLAARTNALTPTTEPTDEGYLSSRAQARAVTVQTKRFEQMIQRIRRQKPFHRAILCLLLEHEGQAMDAQELARRIDVVYTTIRNDPPVELVRMGLISRSREASTKRYQYISNVRALLQKEFSNLNLDKMIDRVLSVE